MIEPRERDEPELFAASIGDLVCLFLIGGITGFTVGVLTALFALSQ